MANESAVEMLKDMVVAFNRHDLDGFMAYFTDDAGLRVSARTGGLGTAP
ncbi:MAG: hypothetical protein WEE67_03355 [Chloroflexota bacterium]